MRKPVFAFAKTKVQISCMVSSIFAFATSIMEPLYFLNLKFQASNHLLWLYSSLCVVPGRKPEDGFSHNEAHIKLGSKLHDCVSMMVIFSSPEPKAHR